MLKSFFVKILKKIKVCKVGTKVRAVAFNFLPTCLLFSLLTRAKTFSKTKARLKKIPQFFPQLAQLLSAAFQWFGAKSLQVASLSSANRNSPLALRPPEMASSCLSGIEECDSCCLVLLLVPRMVVHAFLGRNILSQSLTKYDVCSQSTFRIRTIEKSIEIFKEFHIYCVVRLIQLQKIEQQTWMVATQSRHQVDECFGLLTAH